jgi:hypothetical protein
LPHDWSTQELPVTNGAPLTLFDPVQCAGVAATRSVVGGIGWYHKHFILPPADSEKCVQFRA